MSRSSCAEAMLCSPPDISLYILLTGHMTGLVDRALVLGTRFLIRPRRSAGWFAGTLEDARLLAAAAARAAFPTGACSGTNPFGLLLGRSGSPALVLLPRCAVEEAASPGWYLSTSRGLEPLSS